MSQRKMFTYTALELIECGEKEKAVELLDRCRAVIPEDKFPLDMIVYELNNESDILNMIEAYYLADAPEKGHELGTAMAAQVIESADFFLRHYDYAERYFGQCCNILSYLGALAESYGDTTLASYISELT